ncbi:uncharacterized protein LOC119162423 [Rhipicephalus microplus]|uniref:uncharacterized protein LOC119162423 n=1 Tax=Rhipicephalus microplus TaxID=6941 RepID=UPI003F6CFD0C
MAKVFQVCRSKHRYRGPDTTRYRGLCRSSGGFHHAQQAHPEANTAEHLPDDTTMVVPPPTGGQKSLLPVAHDELPQTPAEEPSDSPPALRRSQRTRKSQIDTCLMISVTEDKQSWGEGM